MVEFKRQRSLLGLGTIVKVVLLALLLVVATIFFLQNTGPSVIHVPFGRPYQAGLIYLLLLAFFAGAITAAGVALIVHRKLKKRKALAEAEEDYELIDEK